MRSSNGCWTCRLRRKKCDEKQPVCGACAALCITCHFDQGEKPEWMDGGVKQEEMVEQLKHEIKEKAHRRRGESMAHIASDSTLGITTGVLLVRPRDPEKLSSDSATRAYDPGTLNRGTEASLDASSLYLQRKVDRENIPFERSDSFLLIFYLNHLFPFLFPFYRPSLYQGDRAWVLEMIISSPIMRQATLCQSSYFFSLVQGVSTRDVAWEIQQSRDVFGGLRQALEVLDRSKISEHPHCAVRTMASIMQIHRFEVTVLNFTSCQAHLKAALALFRQLLRSDVVEPIGSRIRFNAVAGILSSSSWGLPAQRIQIPSAEEAAFRFSSGLLILDDLIASTVLQERPELYDFHRGLLDDIDGTEPPIRLDTVIGCQNWVLRQMGEIAVLETWKQQRKKDGNLNVIEMVQRATPIKDSLETRLKRLDIDPVISPKESGDLLHAFTADCRQQTKEPPSQSLTVTRVWAHAALVYLHIVVSGWQPASTDVRHHVCQIIDLVTHQAPAPALLRTMVWPFCVAGCLAAPSQEAHIRELVAALQPPDVFGAVHKALEVMENVWRNRNTEDAASGDLATCFRCQGGFVLLV